MSSCPFVIFYFNDGINVAVEVSGCVLACLWLGILFAFSGILASAIVILISFFLSWLSYYFDVGIFSKIYLCYSLLPYFHSIVDSIVDLRSLQLPLPRCSAKGLAYRLTLNTNHLAQTNHIDCTEAKPSQPVSYQFSLSLSLSPSDSFYWSFVDFLHSHWHSDLKAIDVLNLPNTSPTELRDRNRKGSTKHSTPLNDVLQAVHDSE